MGLCSRCREEKPEGRIHRWCAACLRDYKEQRCGASGMSQAAMMDALERYTFSEEHHEQQQEQQEMSPRTADDEEEEEEEEEEEK